ncbi:MULTISPECIES: hypothetical protein [Nitrospirillum]|uniref:UrcA family protein n=1 Tax=Nitrospirillum amazonense TaxID=28077 RepID=A0A560FC88_9PROT|nr:hypothetical protein [Nitrospirillum amazonense]MEC4589966.1 hypothetical protein [Nitrospirillum amazonense]TWB19226.1 hypothetical protein FBZ88_12281 [Nitrospirillum amazonense]
MNTRTLSNSIKYITAAMLAGAAVLGAPAAFAAAATAPIAAGDAAAVRHTCHQTLGLTINDVDYAACVSTLEQALAVALPAERHSAPGGSSACAEVGLLPGSAGYARCATNLEGALIQARLAPN